VNATAAKPSDLTRLLIAVRTDSSSSTIEISEVLDTGKILEKDNRIRGREIAASTGCQGTVLARPVISYTRL